MFDRITFDPKVHGGRACVRGLRIPVSLLVSQVAHGASQEEILKDYPDLEPDDLRQAMEYAACLTKEESLLAASPTALEALADEALAEHRSGRSHPLDPDVL